MCLFVAYNIQAKTQSRQNPLNLLDGDTRPAVLNGYDRCTRYPAGQGKIRLRKASRHACLAHLLRNAGDHRTVALFCVASGIGYESCHSVTPESLR